MKDQKRTKDVSTGLENAGPIMQSKKCRIEKCGIELNTH